MKILRECDQCHKLYFYRNAPSDNGKHCSRKCSAKSMTKKVVKNCLVCKQDFEVHKYRADIAKTCGMKCRNKMYTTGRNWKGDNKEYFSLHYWVRSNLGRANHCEQCGTTTARKYEWANKSHEYRKDLTDWLSLCKSCHLKHDDLFNYFGRYTLQQ